MMNSQYDIAVVGSGFAGSLFAMIARRLGRSVILIERGSHPRFAIGESSTPLANLLLEELAVRYDLPRLLPLCKWGTWQGSYPKIAVGLKRGFTFYHHVRDARFAATPDRCNELLVAASPHDSIGDTHWYRPDLDQFLVTEAQLLGVEYQDHVNLEHVDFRGRSVSLRGRREGKPIEIETDFVVDASGPRGFLQRILSLPERSFPDYPATEALYAHFRNVKRMNGAGDFASRQAPPPFPHDDAAVHHVFDGGWVWALRFNNGITSAGVACTAATARRLQLTEGAEAWERLLAEMPSLAELFKGSRPITPFIHAPRLPFRTRCAAGDRWAMLPSAAGVVDPLLSTGIPLTLLGIARLVRILDESWTQPPELRERIDDYAERSLSELDATARLVAALYATMNDFPLFSRLSLLYFAAASFSETARRLGRDADAASFLLYDDSRFDPPLRACCNQARYCGQNPVSRSELMENVLRAIEPIDVAGLGDVSRKSWFPVKANDLRDSAGKLGASREEINLLLARCGFDV